MTRPVRTVARSVAVATAVAVALSGCGPSAPTGREGSSATGPPTAPRIAGPEPASTSDPTTAAPGSPPTPAGPADATTVPEAPTGQRRHPVGVIERAFVDPARGRTLPVRILYPARGTVATAPGGEVPTAADAPPSAAGPFPLVLFAHGYRLPADGYDRLLAATAAHGYVVAAPDFPGTSSRSGTGNRSDLTNQPADLSFVADQVVALGGSAPDGTGGPPPVPAIAHPDRIAVAGHSDGGLTATALAYNRTYRDPRVAAAASFTGGIGLFGGAYDAADPPPLLLVHGTGDGTNPFSASVGARDALATPSWLVAVDGGDHIGPYMFGTGRPDLGDALADFLDGSLQGDPTGLDRLATTVAAAPGLALVP